MAADIYLGSVYYEDTTDGNDTTPDVIDVTWTGGPAGAELKTLTINMDKNGNGTLDPGETFFDTAGANFGVGQFGNANLQLTGNGFTILSATPLGGSGIPGDWDGATGITLTFSGFEAGEHLLIKVDIDEHGFMNGASALVEGDEFQYSKMTATFAAPHYKNVTGSDVFLDEYLDAKADQVGLPRDDYFTPPTPIAPLRTAGAFIHLQPEPLGAIRGNVHVDYDGDCLYDPGELKLGGVTIELLDAQGNVIRTTTTNANGEYEFLDLEAGSYGVREIQPAQYFNGGTLPGTINGVKVGTTTEPNVIKEITLLAGQQSVENNFCEKVGSISGRVHVDVDGDCDYEPNIGDTPIAGVTMELLDVNGNVIATTQTLADGTYKFDKLLVGTYAVRQIQPSKYFNGFVDAGTINGIVVGTESDNKVSDITLVSGGKDSIDNDFCERYGSISGRVHVDLDEDCDFEPQIGDFPLQGVTIQLLDAQGNVVATTLTAADGTYKFSNLLVGTYSVREVQPTNYFNGGQDAGTFNGVVVGVEGNDRVDQIVLAGANKDGIDYDFCERVGSIRGRVIVDQNSNNVVDPGVEHEKPLAGVTILLYQNGVVVRSTTTDADGRYLFDQLQRGTYTVVEVQPSGYRDGADYLGKINGVIVGSHTVTDVHANIALLEGRHGVEYDFTEFVRPDDPQPPPFRDPPPPPPGSIDPPPPPTAPVLLTPPPPITVFADPLPVYSGVGNGYTWHLSVVNGGRPRTPRMTNSQFVASSRELGEVMAQKPDWNSDAVRRGQWILRTGDDDAPVDRELVFGVDNGIPVTGDFNGDGATDVGVFRKGSWYVDLNGNGKWDDGDMWAKLGHENDLPVTGDWDGDGKSDIAIFGREWAGDSRHIAAEPGLPSDVNAKHGKTKNVPPTEQDATLGIRALQLTSAGKVRADLIDHVFLYGWAGDRPIAGDWTGEGQSMIGLFREGSWIMDINGDGKYDDRDRVLAMGEAGDLPVIGDFNGDTKTDLGIYRNGLWHIDTNNDGVLDARDRAFTFGEGADRPVVGDWDGDGIDDPGLYRDLGTTPTTDSAE